MTKTVYTPQALLKNLMFAATVTLAIGCSKDFQGLDASPLKKKKMDNINYNILGDPPRLSEAQLRGNPATNRAVTELVLPPDRIIRIILNSNKTTIMQNYNAGNTQ